jgi:hypothetical protein
LNDPKFIYKPDFFALHNIQGIKKQIVVKITLLAVP